jgi:hypothetical protein
MKNKMENSISIIIAPADLQKVNDAVKTITETLAQYVVALTPAQRRQNPKMGDGTLAFVKKAAHYAETNPEVYPPYFDAQALKVDVTAIDTLLQILRPLHQVTLNLSDTVMACGTDAYRIALALYQSVKRAAGHNVPGAKAIAEELRPRFRKTVRTTEPDLPGLPAES